MPYVLALLFGIVAVLLATRGLSLREKRWIVLGLPAHYAGTAGVLMLHYRSGSDMEGYGPHGMAIASLLRLDFVRWAPELVKAILRRDTQLPVVPGGTGAMDALSGAVFFFIGDSLEAACLATGTLVLVGQSLLYRVLAAKADDGDKPLVGLACMFVPSVTFWTSGLVKEAFCLTGLGFLVYGAYRLLALRKATGAAFAVIGLGLVSAVKPYALAPCALATGAWIFAARGGQARARYLVLGAIIAVAGIAAIGELFPELGVDQLGDTIARQRTFSREAGGGSYVDVDMGEGTERDHSLFGLVKFVPLALATALFRPLLFEARNVTQLAASLEGTAIIVLSAALLFRVKLRTLYDTITRDPVLFSTVIFAVTFGAAVGLASQNLGTLSRYRAPMMPAYGALVLLLRRRFSPVKELGLRPAPVRALAVSPALRRKALLERQKASLPRGRRRA